MTGPSGLRVYRSHKEVQAGEIIGVDAVALTLTVAGADGTPQRWKGRPQLFAERVPEVGDWFMLYSDGYWSVSPRVAFLQGYREVPVPVFEVLPPGAALIDVVLSAAELEEFRKHWFRMMAESRDTIVAPVVGQFEIPWTPGVAR